MIAGEDAVKAAGERYLPKLESQSEEEYAAYKMRALFFSATARTADGFVGLIFRRAPFVRLPGDSEPSNHAKDTKAEKAAPSPPPSPSLRRTGQPSPPSAFAKASTSAGPTADKTAGQGGRGSSALAVAMAEFSNDADMLGTSLYGYAKNVVTEVISVGRAGTLVDWEGEVEDRAYATMHPAESILNWRMERINGRNLLTMLALHEVADGKGQIRLQTISAFTDSGVTRRRDKAVGHPRAGGFHLRQGFGGQDGGQAGVASIRKDTNGGNEPNRGLT